MNRRLLGIVAALALASLGTMLLVGYVRSAEARVLQDERVVEILVVTKTIAAGTPASDIAGSVRTEKVPAKVRADGAVTDVDRLGEKVAAIDLLPGEQLLEERFVAAEEQERAGVPDGMLEVTVQLDPARAVGGRISVGDTVGVVASFEDIGDGSPVTHLMLHKVLVTAVQASEAVAEKDDEEKAVLAPSGMLLVSLAVTAPAAERVVFAAEHGRLWLTLEPKDADESGTRIQRNPTVLL